MSDEASAQVGGDEPVAVVAPANLDGEAVSEAQAYEAYIAKKSQPAESAEEPATAETESADEADAAPPEEATSETQETDPPEKAPLDLPRSWTKDRAEIWAKLDPATQEILLEQDRKASIEVRRSQNEAAEIRKAAEAERVQAEQARKQYEAQLPALMQTLQDAQQSAFADIRTVDDVTKLANEDPFRYLQWQAHQTKLQAVSAESQRAKDAATKEQQTQWNDFVAKQNALAVEHIPELADKTKAAGLTAKAGDLLRDIGFTQEDLNGFTMGEKVSLYDHRIQRLLFNALKFNEVKSAPAKAVPKSVPPVQRPGVAPPKGAARTENLQALSRKLSESGDINDAFALYQARQGARA